MNSWIDVEIDDSEIIEYVKKNFEPWDVWELDESKLLSWAGDMELYVSREEGGEAL